MSTDAASEQELSSNIKYNAFISYAWDRPDHPMAVNDSVLARQLRLGILSLATPRLRRSDLRIFLDRSVQKPSPDLWREILGSLERSSYLIIICSPLSAVSPGVDREVQHWISLGRGIDKILIVLLAGSLDDSLPRPLRERRQKNGYDPYFVDLRWVKSSSELDITKNIRFQEDVATLTSELRGVAKEELVSDELAIRERTRRIQKRFIIGLSAALVLAILLGTTAWYQRDQARRETNIAEARALAAQSQSLLPSRLDEAQLLAVLAYRRDPNPQTTAALFAAVTASPNLVRYLNADSQVNVLATSHDEKSIVAGTQSGRIFRWSVNKPDHDAVMMFSGPITSLAVNNDATLIAATDGHGIAIWRPGFGIDRMKISNLDSIQAVGLSPSGLTLAITNGSSFDHPTLSIIEVPTGKVTRTILAIYSASKLIMNDESSIIAGSYLGTWQRIDLKKIATIPPLNDSPITGTHYYAETFSENGLFYSWTNGAKAIPVFRTDSAIPDNGIGTPDLVADGPGHDPNALALSPDGHLLAVADSGSISIVPTRSSIDTAPQEQGQTLLGVGTINNNGLQFIGSGRFLASASGNSVILWDRQQENRIGISAKLSVPAACNACPAPSIVLSGDGRKVAIIDGNNWSVTVASAPRTDAKTLETVQYISASPSSELSLTFGPASWSPDSKKLFVGVRGHGSTEVRTGGPDGPQVRTAVLGNGMPPVSLGTVSGATTEVVLNDESSARRSVSKNANLSGAMSALEKALRTNRNESNPSPGEWGLSPDLSRIAAVVDSNVWLISIADNSVHKIPVGDAVAVSFTRDKLCVALAGGPLQVRDPTSGSLINTIPGDQPDSGGLASVSDANIVARLRVDGTIKIIDVDKGQIIGTVGAPGEIFYGLKPGLLITPGVHDLLVVHPYLAEVAGSGELDRFALTSDGWIHVACQSAGRNLTMAEWRQIMGDVEPGRLDCEQPAV